MASFLARSRSDSSGTFSPLMRAAAIGHKPLVEVLLKEGANVNAKGPRDSTALMFAAGGGHLEIVQVLVENGAEVDAVEQGGWSALQHAQADGHNDIVAYLRKLESIRA